jgi:hypothetical protein
MLGHSGVQTAFADINGGKLYYEVAGEGQILVLAHAGVADRRMWNVTSVAKLLASNIHGAQKAILPNTAHLPNMEKPEQFNQIVLEFLQSTQP